MKEYTVYVHKNLKNEKYYVGMTSKEPKKRFNYGFGYRNNSKMWNDIQNSDWNSDWVHGILGKFDNKDDALKYESFLIAMLDSVRNGYNTSSFDSSNYKHHKHSEETRRKMSEVKIGEKAYWFGKHLSEEHRNKISESLSGENNPNFGKHLSEEHRKKIRENNPSKQVLQFSKTGELIAEYPSTREAERKTGCNQGDICRCCKGKYKSCGGYIWKYKEGV